MKPLELIRDTHSLFSRSLFLAIGLPFFGLGLSLAWAFSRRQRSFWPSSTSPLTDPLRGSFWLGFMIAAVFSVVGGAFVAAFFLPKRVLVFDRDTGAVTYTRIFPFNVQRLATFALSAISSPEVIWIEDSDRFNGGYWALKVNLPSNRSVIFPSQAHTPSEEKAEAEALRDEILDLIGEA